MLKILGIQGARYLNSILSNTITQVTRFIFKPPPSIPPQALASSEEERVHGDRVPLTINSGHPRSESPGAPPSGFAIAEKKGAAAKARVHISAIVKAG